MNKGHVNYIILFSLSACIVMYVFEQVIGLTYEMKTLVKIVVFLSVPCLYYVLFTNTKFTGSAVRSWKLSITLSLLTFAIIWVGYFIFGKWVDFNSIHDEIQTKLGVDKEKFIWVSVYIILGNSFLEEYFFRGFIFKQLMANQKKVTAYLFSSILFSVYHMAIFQSWFSIWIMFIILIALFTVGIVFNYLTEKAKTFFGSWLVHMMADLAIILIAFQVFTW